MANYRLIKVIVVILLNAVDRRCPHPPAASGKNDVKRVESGTVHFANLKFSYQ